MDKKIKAELAFVFSQLHEEQLLRIPDELKFEVLNDINSEDFSKFDAEKPFTEQDISQETLEILMGIFGEIE